MLEARNVRSCVLRRRPQIRARILAAESMSFATVYGYGGKREVGVRCEARVRLSGRAVLDASGTVGVRYKWGEPCARLEGDMPLKRDRTIGAA